MEIIKDMTTISADVILKTKIRITLFIPKRKVIFCCSSNSKSKSRNRGEGEGFPSPSLYLIVLPRPSVFSRDVFFHSQKVCFLQPQQGETPQPNNSLRPSNRAGTSAQRTSESLFGHGRRASVGGGDMQGPATVCLKIWAAKWPQP